MDISEESDLTEIDDEDEVTLSSQRSKKKGKEVQDDGSYRIRGALRVPRVANYTTQSLHDQAMAGDIDLDPEYQRDVVWPENKQIGLLDSLFRNFYVPPVIFVVEMRDDGSEHRTCVDGKQRLTSINRFLQGQIPYKDPHTNEKYYFMLSSNVRGKLLPERYRKLFKNKQIVCIEYENLKPDSEREIFQRVQLGMALTPAEKLQAVKSPRATFIRELVQTYVTEHIGVVLELDISRAGDFKHTAIMLMAIDNWHPKHAIDHIVTKWIEKSVEVPETLKRHAREVLDIFSQLTENTRLKKGFEIRDEMDRAKKVSPVEFLASCVLIFHFKEKLTLAQLAEAIKLMRRDIRSREKDIRTNGRILKVLSDFILKLKIKKLKPDPGNPVAIEVISSATKRKRTADSANDSESEDDNEVEVAVAAKRAKKVAKKSPRKTVSPPTPAASHPRNSIGAPTPNRALPRGPATSESASILSERASSADPRRRMSDIAPKAEPSPTPVPPTPVVQPPLFAASPPVTPAVNWPIPYPTPHSVQGQTPPPGQNAWNPQQSSLFHTDRLAALRAAKELSATLGSFSPSQWPQGGSNGFPFTPPASQAGSLQTQYGVGRGALGDSLMSRMGMDNASGRPTFDGVAPQQQNGVIGRGPENGWRGGQNG